MQKNEIKKALYKENPTARLVVLKSGIATYITALDDSTVVTFNIPVLDMGEAAFREHMEAKLLIRWIAE